MLFHGVWPALTTPFLEDGSIDFPTFRSQIDFQVNAGVDGLVLAGTLGEASTLELHEKVALFDAARIAVAGRAPIAVNVAESATQAAVSLVRQLTERNVDGFMLLPPMRYTSDPLETQTYLETVIQNTDRPIMLYNNPVDYKIEITPHMFEALLRFKNVQAVKESTREMRNMTRLIAAYGDRMNILCGVDNIAFESLMMGAHGWVAGLVCAFPEETVAIHKLVKAGQWEQARAIYRWFLPLLDLDVSNKLIQNIKCVAHLVGRGTEHVRKPRLPLSGPERDHVKQVVENALQSRIQLEVPS